MGQSESRPKSGKSPFSINDKRAQQIQEACGKFRILIIGRANAGKTTILQKICNTTDDPVIYDSEGKEIPLGVLKASALRGIHDIDNEMVFKNNDGFSFHDSRGFESGGIDELEKVKTFINRRSKERKLADQLHAIWYCIPVDDSRPFTAAENWFFAKCGTGAVPVIAIFTKFDALDNAAFGRLVDEGISMQDAIHLALERAVSEFETMHLKTFYDQRYPPKAHVYLRDMNQGGSSCVQLIEKTAATMNNEVLQRLFVSTQRNSLELCMRYGIDEVITLRFNEHHVSTDLVTSDQFQGLVYGILAWFPQYKKAIVSRPDDEININNPPHRGIYGYDYNGPRINNNYIYNYLSDATDQIYSQLYSFPITLSPLRRAIHLAIVTAVVADFEYLIWNARHEDTVTKALAIYEKHASTQAIEQSAEEALKSFENHASEEELGQNMFQIALKYRLSPELLSELVAPE